MKQNINKKCNITSNITLLQTSTWRIVYTFSNEKKSHQKHNKPMEHSTTSNIFECIPPLKIEPVLNGTTVTPLRKYSLISCVVNEAVGPSVLHNLFVAKMYAV